MSAKKPGQAVRYAVVGLGHIAQVAVLPAFRRAANSKLVALVSGDPKKRRDVGKQYGVARVYSYEQYEECLAQDVDAVFIALPNHLHRNYAVKAAQAGVHILCEKPMAPTERDCRAMMSAAEKNNVKLMVGYRLHFEEGNLEAVRLVQKGALGNPRVFSSDFAQHVVKNNVRVTESPRRGGGPVYDMGVYCINAARYLYRAEPTEVFAALAKNGEARFRRVEEMASIVLRFPDDRLATFTCSFGAADIGRYTVVGTKGTLTADRAYYASGIKLKLSASGKAKLLNFPKRDQFAAELIYFSDCILHNRKPEPSGLEGLADVRVIEAIYRSAQSGKAVKLPQLTKQKRPGKQQAIDRAAHQKPKTIDTKAPSGETG